MVHIVRRVIDSNSESPYIRHYQACQTKRAVDKLHYQTAIIFMIFNSFFVTNVIVLRNIVCHYELSKRYFSVYNKMSNSAVFEVFIKYMYMTWKRLSDN